MYNRTLPLSVAVAATIALGTPSTAHHGVTGQYDGSVPIVLAGTVVRATFSPPHPVFVIEVTGDELPEGALGRPAEYFGDLVLRPGDLGQQRDVELAPARTFYDLADRVRPGDEVIVVALRNCVGSNQLRSSWLQLADGTVLSYEGDWAPIVNGCR
jgi:hypothetical protein